MPDFYEFFAGGGMVRAGLGPKWRCLFANDFDHKKSRIYRENWGPRTDDVLKSCLLTLLAAPEPTLAHIPALLTDELPENDVEVADRRGEQRDERPVLLLGRERRGDEGDARERGEEHAL